MIVSRCLTLGFYWSQARTVELSHYTTEGLGRKALLPPQQSNLSRHRAWGGRGGRPNAHNICRRYRSCHPATPSLFDRKDEVRWDGAVLGCTTLRESGDLSLI